MNKKISASAKLLNVYFTIQRRHAKCVEVQAAFKVINWLLADRIYGALWAPGALQPLITHFSSDPHGEQASSTTFYRKESGVMAWASGYRLNRRSERNVILGPSVQANLL